MCVPDKTEDLSIHVYHTITGKYESKILAKNISCKYKCRFEKKM